MLLFDSQLSSLPRLGRGKVRDIYAVDRDKMMIVVSDRLSAFDVVLPDPIPDKGRVLTELANFWFDKLGHVAPNHLTGIDPESVVKGDEEKAQVRGRAIVVKKLKPLPVEAVVRGYLIGSGWKDYQATGGLCGITLPAGLRESDRLPEPIFTPATKADAGHDENISEADAAKVVGHELVARLKLLTLGLYAHGVAHAESKGIILADTKFEFGLTDSRELLLIDEMMTPDSSRYWPKDQYAPGGPQPSFDKQYVRDYLESIKWNKQPPVPSLPTDVVERTRSKYLDAYRRLTGRELDVARA